MSIWGFEDYTLKDLLRIRDSWNMLSRYNLENEEGLYEVNKEIERRTDKNIVNINQGG